MLSGLPAGRRGAVDFNTDHAVASKPARYTTQIRYVERVRQAPGEAARGVLLVVRASARRRRRNAPAATPKSTRAQGASAEVSSARRQPHPLPAPASLFEEPPSFATPLELVAALDAVDTSPEELDELDATPPPAPPSPDELDELLLELDTVEPPAPDELDELDELVTDAPPTPEDELLDDELLLEVEELLELELAVQAPASQIPPGQAMPVSGV